MENEQQCAPPIVPVSRDNDIPLSFAQERLWLHDQLEPNTPNNINNAVRISGSLKSDVLQMALDTIVERHEVLRTTFSVVSGNPIQVVNQKRPVQITRIDLTNSPADERDSEIERRISDEARQCFNLSSDLMLRVVLLRLSDNEHVLILTMHHIASDEWSMKIFFQELWTLYGAFAEGRTSPLPDLTVQYADFACWRREWMSGDILQTRLSYWQKQLADSPAVLELPSDRPRLQVWSLKGASHYVMLSERLTSSLRQLSEQEGGTMFILMMAAFKTLLYRYTGHGDICVGTFTANRNRLEIERLIGFFVNTLVLRTNLSDGPGFRELIRRERDEAMDAFAHCDMPFEKLVEVLNPQRDPGRTAIFQVALAFEDEPEISCELPDLSFEFLDSETSVSLYDLSLLIAESAGDMRLTFVYRTDIFNASTIHRLASNFQTLLESIVSRPEDSIFTLPILSNSEQKQILREWNGTKGSATAGACIHELFEAQVERTPDSVAVVFEGREMTYRELNNRANQLAHYLRRHGVGPEVLAGIYEERSLDMVVGLLGILKSGGAYVPMDPGYPQERLNLIIEDAAVSILLTHTRLSARIPFYKGTLVFLDADWADIGLESTENPVSEATAHNAACLLYTSGSTGKPKGAIIQHSALVNFTRAVISQYGLKPSDRILQFASISFDASAEEIYPCLALGAALILRTDEILTDSDFLQKWEEWKLTVLSLPTAYWHSLTLTLKNERLRIPAATRLLIIGGERALPERLTQWQRYVGTHVRLLNTYGPTEATVVTTLYDLTHFNPGTDLIKEVPIGRPIPGTLIYILDTHLQPVPIGVPGELHIGGNNLARGYLNRPDVTAEKFISDPFTKEPGARLYKTGDIARYLEDGNIEFVGRIDHQVKIRGFRIELGEIEALLRQHPAVMDTIVIAREDQPGDKRVAAYVVPYNSTTVHIRDLRDFLMRKLPGYMIPSAFVLMNALPLTPNNKVDRNALPVPDQFIQRLEKIFVAPRNQLELQLKELWEKTLDVSPVGITDNFFELGGHSLLAVRLTADIRKVTRKNISVMAVFHNPTIEQMADIILKDRWAVSWASVVPINAAGSKPPLFWVHDTYLAHCLESDQPLYILSHPNQDENLAHYDTVEKIADKNLEELRNVQPKGPYFIGGYCFWAMVAIEIADKLIKQGEEVSLLFLVEPTEECIPDPSIMEDLYISRFEHHKKKLAPLRTMEKIAYMLNRLPSLFLLIKRKTEYKSLKETVKIAICKAYMYYGYPLPLSLRKFYLYNHHALETAISYDPRVYPGRAVIFYGDKTLRSQADWNKLAAGGVEIYQIAGADHIGIIRKPHLMTWAGQVSSYLKKFQTARGGQG